MTKGSCFMIMLLVVFALAAQAQFTNEQEQRIQKLEQTIQEQQQRIDTLQAKVTDPSAEKAAESYVGRPEAEEDGAQFGYEARGFFIRVPDFELYMSGFMQMGVGVFENDTPDDNSIFPNGVVLATDVYMFKDFHGRIELSFMTSVFAVGFQGPAFAENTQLWDAYIEYLGMRDNVGNPQFAIRAGQTHVPFTMEGQYNPNQGPAMLGSPYMAWSHGRDPGLMLWGVLSDMVEYKMSIHNGEGMNTTNGSDDFLMAGGLRIYPFKKSENADTFLHIGAIRSRDDAVNGFGDVASASLRTSWGRPVFDNGTWIDTDGDLVADAGTGAAQGWRTGVDVGFSLLMPLGDDKVNSIYMNTEFMYITWERDFATGRLPFLEGFGFTYAMQFKHNMTPDVEGAGIFGVFKFSYSDIDNKNSDSTRFAGQIPGQRVWVYTTGLGYSFNKHITAQLDWEMVVLGEPDIYNGVNGNAARDDRADGSDDIEHGWFFQVTAQW